MTRILAAAFALLALAPLAGPARAEDPRALADAALAAYGRGDYAASARLFEEALAAGEEDPGDLYNAACSASLAGLRQKAFGFLDRAVARGFSGCRHMGEDPDLAPLRTDPRWKGLLDGCEAARLASERLWDGEVWKTPYAEDLPAADKVAGLSRLWSEVKFAFVNFSKVPGLDWDRAYRDALPAVLATRSTAEYYRLLAGLLARLRDGHTYVEYPKEVSPLLRSLPAVSTRVADGRVFVAGVLDPALASEGIRPGLEVTAVDGVPVGEYGRSRVAPWVSASTPQDLEVRTFERSLLAGPAGTPVSLTLADEKGAVVTKTLPRLAPSERARLARPRPRVEAAELPSGLLHVRIRSFDDERVVPELEALLPEIEASRGLVLDVRENGGGNSAHGDRILAHLARGTFPAQRWWTRDYRPAYRAWGMAEGVHGKTQELTGDEKAFEGPIVLLVGPRTYSAAEDFAAAFLEARRGKLVGEPTGGSTGQPLRIALPGGGGARICSKRNVLPDGREFVGVGIAPDVVVRTPFEDARAGRDPVLEAAVRLLSGASSAR